MASEPYSAPYLLSCGPRMTVQGTTARNAAHSRGCPRPAREQNPQFRGREHDSSFPHWKSAAAETFTRQIPSKVLAQMIFSERDVLDSARALLLRRRGGQPEGAELVVQVSCPGLCRTAMPSRRSQRELSSWVGSEGSDGFVREARRRGLVELELCQAS